MTYTTAEITGGFLMSGKEVQCLTVYTDRRLAANGGLTKGKKAGTLVEDDVPTLLRVAADVYEQEGSWEAVAELLREAKR